jgi:hypothetical protein
MSLASPKTEGINTSRALSSRGRPYVLRRASTGLRDITVDNINKVYSRMLFMVTFQVLFTLKEAKIKLMTRVYTFVSLSV